MEKLKYTIIKDVIQYKKYCNTLEDLIFQEKDSFLEEIELLTLLIEKWDTENTPFQDLNPIELIKALMIENNLIAKNISEIIGLNKSTVSKILNYHKGLSKETIRKLAEYFKLSQEAFNKPYKLTNEINKSFINASLMNTRKDLSNSNFA